jgi:DNA-binding LacI/PurR family transcriptional regulator
METSAKLTARTRQSTYRPIFEGLRAQITSGELAPGIQLPSTRDLVVTWKSSYSVIHAALTALVREGWLERRHGAGTFITDPSRRFLCAGIYHCADLAADDHNLFGRHLHFALQRSFDRLNKETLVFIDNRPAHRQKTVMPALAEAIHQRRIQCLVALTIRENNEWSLARLNLPTAFSGNTYSPNWATFDAQGLYRGSIRKLREQGCRSIGVFTNISTDAGQEGYAYRILADMRQILSEEDVEIPDPWLRSPRTFTTDLESFGYTEFHKFWKLRDKPDGLIVYPDEIARGVILAILEIGATAVMQNLKLVFHRNASIPLLCPLPVTWAISDEQVMADRLVQIIKNQFNGIKVTPSLVPYTFKTVSSPSPLARR